MKIVEMINELKKRAGAQVFFDSLCRSLTNYDCKNNSIIIVVLYDGIDPSFEPLTNNANLKFFSLSKKSSYDIKCSLKLKKILNEINPDVVHIHNSCLITYFQAFLFKKMNWKLVKTYHSIPGRDENRLGLFIEKIYFKKKLISFVGISKKICEESRKVHKGIDVIRIDNGIEIVVPKKNLKSLEYDFICVASLTEVKNHLMLFRVFNTLYGNTGKKLICVGDGPLKTKYNEYLKSNRLENNVIMYGSTDSVLSLLNQSKVFVLSSTREGNPISILEAMSQGLPIIAPKIGGIPDIVEDGVNGFLFDVCDENEMQKCLLNISNENVYKRIKKNNLKKSKEFDINFTAKSYLNFFKTLLK